MSRARLFAAQWAKWAFGVRGKHMIELRWHIMPWQTMPYTNTYIFDFYCHGFGYQRTVTEDQLEATLLKAFVQIKATIRRTHVDRD